MSTTGVETKCPSCGYPDAWPMFTWNRCRGGCGVDYLAIPLDKEAAMDKLLTLMEMVRELPEIKKEVL